MVKSEFILGLMGAILGLLVSVSVIIGSNLLLGISGSSSDLAKIPIYGYLLLVISFMGIVGADFADFDLNTGGKIMIICAVVGSLIAVLSGISVYLPAALFLVTGGIMALVRQDSTKKESGKK